jgi:hypothetical protein
MVALRVGGVCLWLSDVLRAWAVGGGFLLQAKPVLLQ